MQLSPKIIALCLFMMVATFVVQGWFFPDAPYSWMNPVVSLINTFFREWFPSKTAVALFLGALIQKNKPPLRTVLSDVLSRIKTRRAHVIFLVLVLIAGFVILPRGNTYNLLDWIFVLIGVVGVSAYAPRIEDTRHILFNIVLAMAMLICSSFVFTTIKATLFVSNTPLDQSLLDFEVSLFGVMPHIEVVHAIKDHVWMVKLLDDIYYSFFQSVLFVSLMLWAADDDEGAEMIEVLILSYLIGGLSYHLFPALGPVYFQPNEYQFLRELPLISNNIQAYLLKNTLAAQAGSMEAIPSYGFIACMPSLHMTHVTLMTFYCRRNKIALLLASTFTVLTLLAIMVLGWHYITDAFFGVLLAFAIIYGWRLAKKFSSPATEEQKAARLAPWVDGLQSLGARLQKLADEYEASLAPDAPGFWSKGRTHALGWTLSLFLFSLPFLLADFPPLVELPLHVDQVRAFTQWLDHDTTLHLQYWTPQTLVYVLIGVGWWMVGATHAGHVAMFLVAIMWSAAIFWVAARRQVPAGVAALATTLFFSSSFAWGFAPFLVGFPLFLVLSELLWGSKPYNKWTALGSAVLLPLLYMSHFLWAAMALVMVLIWIGFHIKDLRARWPTLASALAVAVMLGVWWSSAVDMGLGSQVSYGLNPLDRVISAWTLENTLAFTPDSAGFGLSIFAILLALAGLALSRKRPVLVIPALLLGLAALVAPQQMQGVFLLAERWWAPFLVLAILAGHFPKEQITKLVSVAALAAHVLFMLNMSMTWTSYEETELEGFSEALEALPANETVVGLVLERTEFYNIPVTMHAPTYSGLYKNSLNNVTFRQNPLMPMLSSVIPPGTKGLALNPSAYNPSDARFYHFALIRAPEKVHKGMNAKVFTPVTTEGKWRLYQTIAPTP